MEMGFVVAQHEHWGILPPPEERSAERKTGSSKKGKMNCVDLMLLLRFLRPQRLLPRPLLQYLFNNARVIKVECSNSGGLYPGDTTAQRSPHSMTWVVGWNGG